MNTKYLKYAIGEITLVVAGILIALALNNWNEHRVEVKKEKVYLQGLRRDLTNQLKEADIHESRELSYVKASKKLISNYNELGRFQVGDQFDKDVGSLVNRKTFVRSDPTYAELIASGNIDLIRNNVLKDEIVQYYQFLERVETVITSNNANFIDDKFRNGVYSLSRFTMIETVKSALSPDNLQTDNELVNGLTDINNPKLLEVTQQLLSLPENELRFANLLQFRNTQATIHAFYMQQVRTRTNNLIAKIDAQLP